MDLDKKKTLQFCDPLRLQNTILCLYITNYFKWNVFPTGLSYLLYKIRPTLRLLYSWEYMINFNDGGALFIQKVVFERYFFFQGAFNKRNFASPKWLNLNLEGAFAPDFFSTQREQLHVWYSSSTILILQVVNSSYYITLYNITIPYMDVDK